MVKLNDLIRCEDAIKEICKRTCTPGVLCPDVYCKEVKEWITDDMVVDAVPVRHGRWKHHWDDHDDWLQCSECGYGDEGEVGMNQGTNFCPHCGADMRKD